MGVCGGGQEGVRACVRARACAGRCALVLAARLALCPPPQRTLQPPPPPTRLPTQTHTLPSSPPLFSWLDLYATHSPSLPPSAPPPPPSLSWLDLFAGTGAVGIEALSRGCRQAHFVELSPWVVASCLLPNLEECEVEGAAVVHTMVSAWGGYGV